MDQFPATLGVSIHHSLGGRPLWLVSLGERNSSEPQAAATIAGHRLHRVISGFAGHMRLDASYSAYYTRAHEITVVATYSSGNDGLDAQRVAEAARAAVLDVCNNRLADVTLLNLNRVGAPLQLAIRKAALGYGAIPGIGGAKFDFATVQISPDQPAEDAATTAVRATNDLTNLVRGQSAPDAYMAASGKADQLSESLRALKLGFGAPGAGSAAPAAVQAAARAASLRSEPPLAPYAAAVAAAGGRGLGAAASWLHFSHGSAAVLDVLPLTIPLYLLPADIAASVAAESAAKQLPDAAEVAAVAAGDAGSRRASSAAVLAPASSASPRPLPPGSVSSRPLPQFARPGSRGSGRNSPGTPSSGAAGAAAGSSSRGFGAASPASGGKATPTASASTAPVATTQPPPAGVARPWAPAEDEGGDSDGEGGGFGFGDERTASAATTAAAAAPPVFGGGTASTLTAAAAATLAGVYGSGKDDDDGFSSQSEPESDEDGGSGVGQQQQHRDEDGDFGFGFGLARKPVAARAAASRLAGGARPGAVAAAPGVAAAARPPSAGGGAALDFDSMFSASSGGGVGKGLAAAASPAVAAAASPPSFSSSPVFDFGGPVAATGAPATAAEVEFDIFGMPVQKGQGALPATAPVLAPAAAPSDNLFLFGDSAPAPAASALPSSLATAPVAAAPRAVAPISNPSAAALDVLDLFSSAATSYAPALSAQVTVAASAPAATPSAGSDVLNLFSLIASPPGPASSATSTPPPPPVAASALSLRPTPPPARRVSTPSFPEAAVASAAPLSVGTPVADTAAVFAAPVVLPLKIAFAQAESVSVAGRAGGPGAGPETTAVRGTLTIKAVYAAALPAPLQLAGHGPLRLVLQLRCPLAIAELSLALRGNGSSTIALQPPRSADACVDVPLTLPARAGGAAGNAPQELGVLTYVLAPQPTALVKMAASARCTYAAPAPAAAAPAAAEGGSEAAAGAASSGAMCAPRRYTDVLVKLALHPSLARQPMTGLQLLVQLPPQPPSTAATAAAAYTAAGAQFKPPSAQLSSSKAQLLWTLPPVGPPGTMAAISPAAAAATGARLGASPMVVGVAGGGALVSPSVSMLASMGTPTASASSTPPLALASGTPPPGSAGEAPGAGAAALQLLLADPASAAAAALVAAGKPIELKARVPVLGGGAELEEGAATAAGPVATQLRLALPAAAAVPLQLTAAPAPAAGQVDASAGATGTAALRLEVVSVACKASSALKGAWAL